MRKCSKTNVVSPDIIDIPEFGLKLHHTDKDVVTITFGKECFVAADMTKHPSVRCRTRDYSGLDLRLWTKSKVCAFWYIDENPFPYICKLKDILINKTYRAYGSMPIPKINLEEWRFIFQTIDDCIEATFDDIKQFCTNPPALYNNRSFGRLHTMRPREKVMNPIWRNFISFEYQQDLEYWRNKIGNMDVAEYHLLMYEE